MSGGCLDYRQFQISEIAETINEYVEGQEIDFDDLQYDYLHGYISDELYNYIKEHGHTKPNENEYSPETIKEFKKAIHYLRLAYIYTQRIDWLLSGDDSEESFHERLKEDLKELGSNLD